MDVTRRRFVRGVGLAVGVGAGCVESGDLPDVVLFNDRESSVSVRVSAVRFDDGETVLEDRATLAPQNESGDTRRYQEIASGGETVRISVDVPDGPTGTEAFSDEPGSDTRGLHAEVERDEVNFSEVVA